MIADQQRLSGLHVVIPSISAQKSREQVAGIGGHLRDLGASVTIVANARSVAELELPGITIVTAGRNQGFAKAVNLGASSRPDWRAILIMNDDIVADQLALDGLTRALKDVLDAGDAQMMAFDPDGARRIPKIGDVFANISLLGSVTSCINRRFRILLAPTRNAVGADANVWTNNEYYSFSAVLLTRVAWDLCGSLPEIYEFCFEDAEYTMTVRETNLVRMRHEDVGLCHAKSTSTRNHVDAVLPVIAASAIEYMARRGFPRSIARVVAIVALVARATLVPFASAPVGRHFRGVFWAVLTAIGVRDTARLPAYVEH